MTQVSRETLDRLASFESLVKKWSRKINLVSCSSLARVWERHILDSLQVEHLAAGGSTWADLGSGAGFPGLVVSICRPDVHVTLVEADQRKAAFLQHVAGELDLNARIVAERIERCGPLGADIVSARALAPLSDLLSLAVRHGRPSARFVFPKGKRHREEIDAARQDWSFRIDVQPSRTEKGAVILLMENISRV